ncbi:MAG: hypothetical protein HWE27_04520 [Gammaproteobacteria bacterium]|nr:hypothetical protein [Gammaproteobacteria bacterium]
MSRIRNLGGIVCGLFIWSSALSTKELTAEELAAENSIEKEPIAEQSIEEQSKVNTAISKFEKTLKQKESQFDDNGDWKDVDWIKKKLAHMVEIDQLMRMESMSTADKGFSDSEAKEYKEKFQVFYKEIDEANTRDMKRIIEIHGWPVISKFGKEAENHAWLIVQHADHDIDFQKSVLALLEKLLPKKETNPSSYAYLYDRVASSYFDPSKRALQKYGTQGACKGENSWEPLPMIEPEKVDERRASVGLTPMKEYLPLVNALCSN